MAPVNEPFMCPKSWLSINEGAAAPQSKTTKGPEARELAVCIARARRSLPVPVSPRIVTVRSLGARRSAISKIRFSDSQILSILKQAQSGVAVPDLCREHGISNATFYNWRAKYGGMDLPMMTRLKELEAENSRLKKMYAEERLKSEILKEVLEKK